MVSKTTKKVNVLYFAIAITFLVLIGLFYSLFGLQGFSIISSSQVKTGDDGVPYWVIFADAQYDGSKYVFSISNQELEPAKVNDGTVVPENDIELQMRLKEIVCSYPLIDTEQGFQDTIANWFRDDMQYYGVNVNTKTSAILSIKDNYGTTQEIDALDFGDSAVFKHGDGELVFSSTGGLKGNYNCPQLDGYAFGINEKTGKYNWFSERYYVGGGIFGIGGGYIREPADDYITGIFDNCTVSYDNGITKPEVKCSANEDISIVNPTAKITADARYLDFKFIPTTIGVPKIVEILTPETVSEGNTNSISVRVKNVGTEDGYFKLSLNSVAFATVPNSLNFNLNAGEEDEKSFVLISPTITSSSLNADGTFKLCSISDFGQSQCVTDDFDITIEEDTTLDKLFGGNGGNTCGNNVCDANENYATCSSDCKAPIVCDGLHMLQYNNKCVCDSGYTMAEDDYGQNYCEKDKSDTIVLIGIFALVLTILVAMVVVAKRRKK